MNDKYKKIENLNKDNRNVLEFGCGQSRKFRDSITLDIMNFDSVDVVVDIGQGLSFIADNSIDEIHSYHFLEHIEDFEFLMKEIYRVLKVGGRKIGAVPHFSNPHFYSDYTHKSFFGLYTFYYMSKSSKLTRPVPTFYNEMDFKIIEIKFNFYSFFMLSRLRKKICKVLFNLNDYIKEYYEENLCYFFPANEIRFVLEK